MSTDTSNGAGNGSRNDGPPGTVERPDPQRARKAAPDASTTPSPLPDLDPASHHSAAGSEAPAVEPLNGGATTVDSAHFDVVMDIPVRMSVEVGRADISLRHLVQLGHGSLVELDRPATAPLDIRVNGVLIARGEVVVVNDEKMGIRVTDVVSQAERLKRLR
ncbi:MAG: flagellar motor switch protein FliN [Alphaproteobacteria bacterium]|nr:flagellar motor switch protein FliN [Alphaproteobacteria bacterium]MDE1967365.1 flagellar motor switch protein FliN [Alphaproteobacteria bacterium]MDE2512668.1 flagellar motor switch protein FliN [Alphaproteobacteria bacterium]